MKTVISFVLDAQPKFLIQGLNLLTALKLNGDFPAPDTELVVHHTSDVEERHLEPFRRAGAMTIPIVPFGEGPAVYCNKLRQLETPAIADADRVILLDADILPLARLASLDPGAGAMGRPVDVDNPPEDKIILLLERAGLSTDLIDAVPDFATDRRTLRFNCNGGMYVLSRPAVAQLKIAWPRWARFCLGAADILGPHALHADQLGFALAMIETDLPFAVLPAMHNVPTHLGSDRMGLLARGTIQSFHYHGNMDNHGLLTSTGVDWIDAQIADANARLRSARRDNFDNAIFWDFRYQKDPALGSGIGSRGEVLRYKQELLGAVLDDFSDAQVVDVGCGDIETTRPLKLGRYLGLDVSKEAIRIAQDKRPDWSFSTRPLADLPEGFAAVTICLDVLIHQKTAEAFEGLLSDLLRVASQTVIVSGYDTAIAQAGIVYFHGSLRERLARDPSVARVARIGAYHGASLLVAVKNGPPSPDRTRLLERLDTIEAAFRPAPEETPPKPSPASLLKRLLGRRD